MMKYTEGKTGRVLIARFDDGEDFISAMNKLVSDTSLESAVIFFLGALRSGEVVAGPVADTIPPVPHWVHFDGAWEVVGIGTLFQSDEGPMLHLHGSIGRGRDTLVGCLRKIAEVFLVVEVVILEILGTDAERVLDARSAHYLLDPSPHE